MSNPNPPKQQSIEDIGLRQYLNDSAQQHNNYSYEDFCKMLESEVNPSNLARVFNVSRATMVKWIGIFERSKS